MKNILLRENGTTQITSADIISLTYETQCNNADMLRYGTAIAGCINATIHGDLATGIQDGEQITYFHTDGTTATKIGVFYASAPSRVDSATYRVTMYDGLTKTDKIISEWLGSHQSLFPMTLYALADHVADECGLSLADSTWTNSTITVSAFNSEGITGRQVLQLIAELGGLFVMMDTDGYIHFRRYETNSTNITTADYYMNGLNEVAFDVQQISGVRIKIQDADIGYIYPSSAASNIYDITGNLLSAYISPTSMTGVAQNIYNAIVGLSYRPVSINLVPSDKWHVGDKVRVYRKDNTYFDTLLMHMSWSVSGVSAVSSGEETYDSNNAIAQLSYGNVAGKLVRIERTQEGLEIQVSGKLNAGDPAAGINTGTEENTVQVKITSEDILFNVPGENGDTVWDESGMTVGSIVSPSVHAAYWSDDSLAGNPTRYTVSDTPLVGTITVGGLADVFSALSGKDIPSAGIVVDIAKNLVEPDITLSDISGGAVTIQMGTGYTLEGNIVLSNIHCPVTLKDMQITCAENRDVIHVVNCTGVTLDTLKITADQSVAANKAAVYAEFSQVYMSACDITNAYNAVSAEHNAHVTIDTCIGSTNRVSYYGSTGSILSLLTKIPKYTVSKGVVDGSTLVVDTGNAVPSDGQGGDTPVETTTVTLNAQIMRTRNDGGWMTGNRLASGWYSGAGKHYGLMVFNITSLIGHGYTVKSAKLTFKRISGGAGSSSTVRIGMTTNTSASGNVNPVYATETSVTQGSTKTVTIPNASIQALLDGTYKSLCFYSTDSSAYNSAAYSRNYMVIDSSSVIPVLTITYA